jgi:hypothetical protein
MAFYDCTSLSKITIPKSVLNIGKEAFWDCPSLKTVTILNEMPPSIESNSFTIEEIKVPKESLTKYKRSKIWKKIAKYTPIN